MGGGGRGRKPFTFPARFAGFCGCCGTRFAIGVQVEYDPDNVLVITGCEGAQLLPDEEEQAEARTKRCDRCFLVHAVGQEGCE